MEFKFRIKREDGGVVTVEAEDYEEAVECMAEIASSDFDGAEFEDE